MELLLVGSLWEVGAQKSHVVGFKNCYVLYYCKHTHMNTENKIDEIVRMNEMERIR